MSALSRRREPDKLLGTRHYNDVIEEPPTEVVVESKLYLRAILGRHQAVELDLRPRKVGSIDQIVDNHSLPPHSKRIRLPRVPQPETQRVLLACHRGEDLGNVFQAT